MKMYVLLLHVQVKNIDCFISFRFHHASKFKDHAIAFLLINNLQLNICLKKYLTCMSMKLCVLLDIQATNLDYFIYFQIATNIKVVNIILFHTACQSTKMSMSLKDLNNSCSAINIYYAYIKHASKINNFRKCLTKYCNNFQFY